MQSPWRRGDGRVEGARPGAGHSGTAGPILLDRSGAFGYTMRAIPRNDLLTSVAELGVVALA